MIRDAVIHLLSEQPVIADLLVEPSPGDANLICTNLRTLDGKRPVFIDQSASTFIFPYRHVRFIEIRPARDESGQLVAPEGAAEAAATADEGDLEIDEDFLRRIREA